MTTKKVTALTALTVPAVGDVLLVIDISEPLTVDQTKKISMTNLGKIMPTLLGLVDVGYATVTAKGKSGAGTVTFDFSVSNIQSVRLTGNCTFAFTDPAVTECGLTIYLLGDGTLRDPTVDGDGDADWADNAEPDAWGSTNNAIVGIMFLRYNSSLTPS